MDGKRQKLDIIDIEDIIIYDPENEDEQLKSLLDMWGCSSLYEGFISNFCSTISKSANLRVISKGRGVTYETIRSTEESDYVLMVQDKLLSYTEMVNFRNHHREWKSRMIGSKTQSTIVDLKAILSNGGEKATEITKFFKENVHLTDPLREQLVGIIIKAKPVLSRPMMNNVADQICNVFPGEEKRVYYENKLGRDPTGLLYVRYSQSRRTQSTARTPKEDTPYLLTGLPFTIIFQPPNFLQNLDDEQQSINFVNDRENFADLSKTDLLFEHWQTTFSYRYSKAYVAEDALQTWPALQEKDALPLIKDDFRTRYGRDIGNSMNSKWNDFIFKNSLVISEGIKNSVVKRSFLRLQSENDFNIRDREIMKAFHNLHYVIPTKTSVNKKTWTPTIPDSVGAFIKIIKNVNAIPTEMKKQKVTYADRDIPDHPIVFEVGNAEKSAYFVAICEAVYECESLIDAVDSAFKFFVMFNIPFPPQCKNFWMFLNQIFYKIDLQQEPNFKMMSILDSFEF